MLSTGRFRLNLLAIVLVWLVLRVVFWNGYYTEDAPGYVTDAIWTALGKYHARDHVNGLNVATYLPVALPIRLLGKSEIGLSLWPLSCSLLGLFSLAGLSRILFGRSLSLLAALLYATYPGDVFFSTVVMPDALQAGWLSFSLFLVALAYVRPATRLRVTLAGGGIAMGVCHLIRANDVVLLPVGVCAVAACSRIWKRRPPAALSIECGAYLSGWALVGAAEGLAYLWAAQDFFLRFHVVNRHYGTLSSIAQAGLNTDPRTIPFSLFAPLVWWTSGGWGQMNLDQAYHALLFCWALVFLVLGVVALVARKGRAEQRGVAGLAMAALWLFWPLLYHQFGSQSLTHLVPMHRLSRHLVVYAPGAMFATVAGCFFVRESMRTMRFAQVRALVMPLGVAILLIHVYFSLKGEQIAYDAFHRIKGTYSRIRERLPVGVQSLVADPGDLCFFDFWMNPLGSEQVRMVAFAAYSGCEQIKGGVVLTQSSPGWEGTGAPVIQDTVARLPCLIRPPATWHLVYDGYPEKIFQVGGS